ncbi:hypothetical protein SO802_015571 [Lithocarpus litseifolius]|uniref:Reverse transcriptase domain-containing protein n=1 Tax=Lithocarpus litseifolius TaxID=425828 RepID=A0AAW2CXD1_9ROSI
MACVTSVSFEVLVNGGKSAQVKPSRGLRQGDPLSSYLFILGQEVLSRMIEQEFQRKNINGVKASINGPAITHIMYDDDIVLFSKATRKDATAINEWIIKYCKWSGQNLNRSKSGIFFSKQTLQQSARAIKQILQMKKLMSDAIYLGALLFLTRSPKKDFNYLLNKLEGRLAGWRTMSLSWAGRCTLINSVTQTTPIYTMSSFKVPNSICNKLDALFRKFWWKPKKPTGKFLALKSWDKLCTPKDKRGPGFKKVRDSNSALLAKLAWMIASKWDSLCMSILRAKYKAKEGWLHENISKHSSPIWRAIEEVKSIIVKGACYLIGDGASINVWQDPWVPWIDGFRPKPKTQDDPRNPLMVSHLMDQETRVWKDNLIQNIFDAKSLKAILSILISLRPKPDKLIWVHNPKGNFTVKSAFQTLIDQHLLPINSDVDWKKIWKIKAPERVKMLIWRIGANILPTNENLQ